MKVCCFPYCAFLGFITTHASTVVNSNGEDVISETFKTKGSTRILQTDKTTDVYSKSIISCADICLSDPQCCVASYSKGTSTCRTDTLSAALLTPNPLTDGGLFNETLIEDCEHLGGKLAELETSEENEFIKNEVRTRNTGVYGYWIGGYDFYNDNDMKWASQPDQSMSFRDFHPGEPGGLSNQLCMENCEGLGGKLVELETSEKNEFIKDELSTRNTGVSGYWINGYKFYHDNEMEWASQPNQTMSFSDINPGEPDGPTDQLCMVMWTSFDFRWGDYHCYISFSYVCEFMHPYTNIIQEDILNQ
ncbi:unnamed protein product [Mytilus edulis]|uniref:C-type lectin domain-containing protein n=1 Tax=Mytilus edulis TaxID=6550 RepID=A0A8S3V477_MYTED|nr:unnamed protein product [Mytilus edulis]